MSKEKIFDPRTAKPGDLFLIHRDTRIIQKKYSEPILIGANTPVFLLKAPTPIDDDVWCIYGLFGTKFIHNLWNHKTLVRLTFMIDSSTHEV